ASRENRYPDARAASLARRRRPPRRSCIRVSSVSPLWPCLRAPGQRLPLCAEGGRGGSVRPAQLADRLIRPLALDLRDLERRVLLLPRLQRGVQLVAGQVLLQLDRD